MTTWKFPCPDPAAIKVSSWASGSVAVSGEQTAEILVEITGSRHRADVDDLIAEVRVSFEDGRLTVTGPKLDGLRRRNSLDLTIITPAGSDCDVRTASGDVSFVGQLGEVAAETASGDVTVASAAGDVSVRTSSGDVFIDEAGRDVRANSASGDIRVAHARGAVEAKSASGDLTIAGDGPVMADSKSGDIDVKELSGGNANLASMSGDVRVTVTPGIAVYLDLSSTAGSVRSDLDETDGPGDGPEQSAALEIRCRTVSGDIRIAKGRATATV
jgi:DUF4097 and DUF4098 domain-containing protein YvlB